MQPIFDNKIYCVHPYIGVFLSLCSHRFWSYVQIWKRENDIFRLIQVYPLFFASYALKFCPQQCRFDFVAGLFVAHIYVCTNSAFRLQSSSGLFFTKYANCKGLPESAANYSETNYWTDEINEYMSVLAREKLTLDVSSSKTMSSG